ncbi:serine/threonine-protein kinase SBK1-like [Hyperolius riggenbachi]|uniref:serine/threonine-protein kinase SBK1-like n=1 Tax=Hyperolius riggenbachi TaxID=752182 RepID=UPI0035A301F4
MEFAFEVLKTLEGIISLASRGLQKIKLQERFHIMKRLGEGGFGAVLLAKEKTTDQKMALKMMERATTNKRKFLMEFGISAYLSSHPNIVQRYTMIFKTEEYFIFSQEVAPLGDLFDFILPDLGLTEGTVKNCMVQISDALHFMAEKEIVHMDLKPENVLVFERNCQRLKVTDFGLARIKGTTIRGQSGTIFYKAPELCQLTGNEELFVDSSIDVWALGVMMICLMTGEFPWEKATLEDPNFKSFVDWQSHSKYDDPPAPWDELSSSALSVCRNLLAIDPHHRCDTSDLWLLMEEL